jgi:hypothetical protein
MNLSVTKASIVIWTIVASLLLVAAFVAGYAFFFHNHDSGRDQACQSARQRISSHDAPITDALCGETSR